MRRTGTVVRDTDGALKLRVVRPAECEHCGMCPGRELLLDLPAGDWHVGDEVAIELPGDRLLRASALSYLSPLTPCGRKADELRKIKADRADDGGN